MDPDNEQKWDISQLQNISSLRTDEHNTWVNFFNVSLTTTAILLVALFTTGGFPNKAPGIIICSFGFIISAILLYLQSRALITMKGQEQTIREVEKALSLNDSTKNLKPAQLIGARSLMTMFGFLQIIVWVIGIILFILLYE
jgi:hypothetical protein